VERIAERIVVAFLTPIFWLARWVGRKKREEEVEE